MTTCLVSGATGFVGRALLDELGRTGIPVIRLTRKLLVSSDIAAGDDFVNIEQAWPAAYRPDCVVHLAARVHVMHDTAADPMAAFRKVNVDATMRVARAAAKAGTRRFVYVSSVKAIGEVSVSGPLAESDPARPIDPYGITKLEAEHALADFSRETGIEVAIIRPPLVYGPGVGANFMSLMKAVSKGIPLPLGSATAKRSLVAVENLASAIVACVTHPAAAGETFHVSDDEDVSVAELIRLMAKALDTRARLLPVPVPALRAIGAVTGRRDVIQRLVEPLQLDVKKIRSLLGWTPRLTVLDGLKQTAAWYLSASDSIPRTRA